MHRFSLKPAFFLLSAIFMASCKTLPTGQLSQLATSATGLHASMEVSFNKTITILEERTWLKYTDTLITMADYSDATAETLKPIFSSRLQYITVLDAYFSSLQALATKNNGQGIDESATKLNAALSGLDKYIPAGNQGIAKNFTIGFSIITDFIAHSVSQGVQLKYLKLAMDKAQPGIDSVCKYIALDLQRAERLLQTNDKAVIERLIATRNSGSSLTERVKWDKYIHARIAEMEALHNSYLASIQLVSTLPNAHRQARAMLDKKGSLKDAIAYVISEANDLSTLYSQLKSSESN